MITFRVCPSQCHPNDSSPVALAGKEREEQTMRYGLFAPSSPRVVRGCPVLPRSKRERGCLVASTSLPLTGRSALGCGAAGE